MTDFLEPNFSLYHLAPPPSSHSAQQALEYLPRVTEIAVWFRGLIWSSWLSLHGRFSEAHNSLVIAFALSADVWQLQVREPKCRYPSTAWIESACGRLNSLFPHHQVEREAGLDPTLKATSPSHTSHPLPACWVYQRYFLLPKSKPPCLRIVLPLKQQSLAPRSPVQGFKIPGLHITRLGEQSLGPGTKAQISRPRDQAQAQGQWFQSSQKKNKCITNKE